jgi:hypothetical protein
MYPNIPINETKRILRNNLSQNKVDKPTIKEILNWYTTITQQNYFTHKDKVIIQKNGLAMGAPTSSNLSELFLQHIEETKLTPITKKLHLIKYLWYVDDILIIFDNRHTDINSITQEFNSLHNNIHFTHEEEQDKHINYLDITIQRHDSHLSFSVYRKPTYTDSIIPHDSNHPTQHKYAAIRFLYNRLDSYHLQGTNYTQENNIVANILHNNQFPPHTQTTA